MAKNRSQDYDVDNRRLNTEQASDNEAGKKFLSQYLEAKRRKDAYPIGNERQRDDRFIVPALNQTDGEITFKNLFRATQT